MKFQSYLPNIPPELSKALEDEYTKLSFHFAKTEWDESQMDAGRFGEAVLRILEWYSQKTYTPLDGRSKPDRKKVVNLVAKNNILDPSLRLQIPQMVELIMDFRNNRNAAHLGGVDPNRLDAVTVIQLASWITAELIRIEASLSVREVQSIMDQMADRQVPIIHEISGRPIVLDTELKAESRAVLLLHKVNQPVHLDVLRDWTEYKNTTIWRKNIIKKMARKKLIYVDKEKNVHLLPPGEKLASSLFSASAN